MIIIYEGIDHSGKSTLAQLQSYTQNIPYYRSIHQKDKITDLEESCKHDWRFFLDISSQTNQNIIFDRSFISQYVYSTCFRKENIMKHFDSLNDYEKVFKEYCKQLSQINHIVYHCTRKDFNNEVDDYIDLSNSQNISDVFNEFFNKYKKYVNVHTLKFEDGILNNIKKVMETSKV